MEHTFKHVFDSATPGKLQITVLQGKTPDAINPKAIEITGQIYAIEQYLSNKEDKAEYLSEAGYVTVNRQAGEVILYLRKELPNSITVTGKLNKHNYLSTFKVNENELFTREKIVKLLRFNKHLFANPDEAGLIAEKLMKFTAQTQAHITASNDNRGNKQQGFDRTVQTGLPAGFTLKTPLFEGHQAEYSYFVELCYDVTDAAGIKFWLESPELALLQEKETLGILSDATETAAAYNIAIINI